MNDQNRRRDDSHPDQPLDWQSDALHPEYRRPVTQAAIDGANKEMIDAGLTLLALERIEAAVLKVPGTEPQLWAAIGAPESIRKLLPAVESSTAGAAKGGNTKGAYEAWLLAAPQAGAGKVEVPADRVKLRDEAIAASEAWANAEFAHANSLGKGGPGLVERCNKAEEKARAAIESLAASPAAPVAEEGKSNMLRDDTASQSQAVPSELASLQRYEMTKDYLGDGEYSYFMADLPDGEFVRFGDVLDIFSHSAATGKVPESFDEWSAKAAHLDFDKWEPAGLGWRNPRVIWEAGWKNGYSHGYTTGLGDGRAEFTNPVATSARERAEIAPSPAAKVITKNGNGTFVIMSAPDVELPVGAPLYLTAPLAAAVPAEEASDVQRDAARYRFLRATTKAIRNDEGTERIECTPDLFDASVDAGMRKLGCAPAEPAPIQASALTDDEIKVALEAHGVPFGEPYVYSACKVIEREVLARLSKPTARPNADCSRDPSNCPDNEGYGCECGTGVPTSQGAAQPVAWAMPDGLERLARVRDGYADSPLLVVYAKEAGDYTEPLYRHIAAQAPAGRDAQPSQAVAKIEPSSEAPPFYECAANMNGHRWRNWGPNEEHQCEWCGEARPEVAPHAAEQTEGSRDA